MNKQDLIGKVSETTGTQKSETEKMVNAIFDQITSELKVRGEVRLVGFGTFKTSIRKASQGRNPRTNEVIQIPQSTRPKFTAGKGLKEAVNNPGGGE
jgi:DNA-binding protein HU-beta|tara:strand:+ start:343 stop:633 length:291 start_codon:yes stop_codon:yes gene_type:complete